MTDGENLSCQIYRPQHIWLAAKILDVKLDDASNRVFFCFFFLNFVCFYWDLCLLLCFIGQLYARLWVFGLMCLHVCVFHQLLFSHTIDNGFSVVIIDTILRPLFERYSNSRIQCNMQTHVLNHFNNRQQSHTCKHAMAWWVPGKKI